MSCPTRGMEVLNYLRPLELELRKVAGEAYIRTKKFEKIPLNAAYSTFDRKKGHRQWCEELFSSLNFELWKEPLDAAENATYFWDNKFIIDHDHDQ